jgi:pilus assembly protein CpaB
MNSKRIALAVALSLLIAVVVTYGFVLHTRSQQSAATGTVRLVAASRSLPAGSSLGADTVVLVDWPKSALPTGSFSKLEDVIGRSVIYPVNENQPILDHDVAVAGSGIGLTVKIPKGMRAVSVRSNDVVGVAGFLYPGSHVDVLVTSKPDNSQKDLAAPRTQTILSNVEVLTAGQKIEPDPSGKPETVNVVTLLLLPEDGEKLVLASSQGAIQFVLRNGADQQTPQTRSVDMAELLNGAKPVEPPKKTVVRTVAHAPVHAVSFYEVETITGGKRSVDKFE